MGYFSKRLADQGFEVTFTAAHECGEEARLAAIWMRDLSISHDLRSRMFKAVYTKEA